MITVAGGKQMDTPDFSDAVPPKPDKQGDAGPKHYVDENTFESGMPPKSTAADESNWEPLVNSAFGHPVRGYRPNPVGGSYNPGQGTSGRSSSSATQKGAEERSAAA